ncbi:MAG: VOC family protein [Bryobacteraceae bacterium]
MAKPVPDGYHTVTPYLAVANAAEFINFVKAAFGATEMYSHKRPDGSIGHAEVKIGDSLVMIGQAGGEWKPMPAALYVYVPDCDSVYRGAIAAGGVSLAEPKDQFYGDRHGGVKDPAGNQWWIATHIEDVAPEELARRAAASGR